MTCIAVGGQHQTASGENAARCSGTAFTQRLPTPVRHAIIGQLSAPFVAPIDAHPTLQTQVQPIT
jgi:hypothetical protein